MIAAYFDDSGTHGEKSEVVLVAGIFGTQARIESFGHNWQRLLASPVDGSKEPIKRFHAFDCDQSMGEFTRWTRTETDYFRRQLRIAIIEADVAAFGMACFRRDYDELVVGPFRSVLGTAEGFCINQCFVRALGWAQANMYDPEMCFVFDNRPPEVQRYTGTVYDAFARWVQPPPALRGLSRDGACSSNRISKQLISAESYVPSSASPDESSAAHPPMATIFSRCRSVGTVQSAAGVCCERPKLSPSRWIDTSVTEKP